MLASGSTSSPVSGSQLRDATSLELPWFAQSTVGIFRLVDFEIDPIGPHPDPSVRREHLHQTRLSLDPSPPFPAK
jgi:hypothetical protein